MTLLRLAYVSIATLLIPLAVGCAGVQPSRPAASPTETSKPAPDAGRATKKDAPKAILSPRAAEIKAADSLLAEASVAMLRNRNNEAILMLERAIRIRPRSPELWTRLSEAHLAENRLVVATQHIRKAIALASGSASATALAWLQLANIKEAQGEYGEAASIRARFQRGSG